ncbi:MAG: hypothetical protein ACOYOF_15355 [Verrucomicrobiaceae bacterium]
MSLARAYTPADALADHPQTVERVARMWAADRTLRDLRAYLSRCQVHQLCERAAIAAAAGLPEETVKALSDERA